MGEKRDEQQAPADTGEELQERKPVVGENLAGIPTEPSDEGDASDDDDESSDETDGDSESGKPITGTP